MFVPFVMVVLMQAPAERLHIDWLAPEGCPDRSTLSATLESTVPRNKTFSASVRIDEPKEPGHSWRAVVITRLPEGQRTRVVEATDCARVTDAAVLVVTLAATSLAHEPALDAGAAPFFPELDAGVPDLPLEPPAAELPRDPPQRRLRLRLQPIVGANVGVFPLPGVAVGVAVNFERGPLRLELAGAQWLESQTVETRRGARFNLTSVRLKGCWLFELTELTRLGPCLGAEGGPLSATGLGVSNAARGTVFWAAVLPGATLGFLQSPYVHPWVSLEVGVNLVRPTFSLALPGDTALVAHAVGLPVGRLTIGVELIIN